MLQPNRLQVNVMRPIYRQKPPSRQNQKNKAIVSHKSLYRSSLKQYLVDSTLHGLKYVGDDTITPFERIFFGLTIVIMVLMSAYFISNVYGKYDASPMIISLSSISTDITLLPFPAVTICNMNQANKSVVAQIPPNSEEYSMIQSLCATVVDENVTNSVPGKWEKFRRLLINVSHHCQFMLISCKYGGFTYNCTDIFFPVLSDEGLCCTFNAVHRKFNVKSQFNTEPDFPRGAYLESMANDWSPEMGFGGERLKHDRYGYPRPAAGTGTNLGLQVLLDGGINDYYCSSTNSYGFKVLLHSPNESPYIMNYGTSICNGYESRIVASLALSEASEAIRKMDMNIRRCLFEDENILTYYRKYTRRNCKKECVANIYIKHCNCVQYYLPRLHDDVTICGRSDAACVQKVAEKMQEKRNASFICDCRPGCYEIEFDSNMSRAPLHPQAPILQKGRYAADNVSFVNIFYKDRYYRSEMKDEIISFTDVLSSIGGLLGLFLGFSVFSIVEVIYFLTLRPYCNHLRGLAERQQQLHYQRKLEHIQRIRSNKIPALEWHKHVEHTNMDDSDIFYPFVH